MPYRITIEEVSEQNSEGVPAEVAKLYEQTFQDLDVPKIIAAANAKKRTYTPRKQKAQS